MREELIGGLWAERGVSSWAEVGVDRAGFASEMLRRLPGSDAVLVDPWAQLPEWDRPMNTGDRGAAYAAAVDNLEPYLERVRVLRMTSVEAARRLRDSSLDAAYIDGDHTLRGILMDLVSWWPIVKPGGVLCGDDATPQAASKGFEPMLVWPTVRYFAEAVDCPLLLPGANQWVIVKDRSGFSVDDAEGAYRSVDIRGVLRG